MTKKKISIMIIAIGAILFIVGLFLGIPSKELTTYSFYGENYTVIDEYVGGDAYNYIIGASLVGGQIAGAKAQKAIFVSVGLLIMCIGLLALSHSNEENKSIEPSYTYIENKEKQKDVNLEETASEKLEDSVDEDAWLCKKCNEKNESTAQYCKSCGEYR